jgi:hypothetical protein
MKPFFALLCFFFFAAPALSAQSPQLDWVFTTGGTGNDFGNAIGRDAQGNVYTAGSFAGTADFDPGPGVFNLSSVVYSDIFILKLDTSGNYIWAKGFGGSGDDRGFALTTDAQGNVYATSYFAGTVDFDPQGSVVNKSSNGGNDLYIQKLGQSVSAIAENSEASSLSVYPNPAQEKAVVRMNHPVTNEAQVSVTDLSGRIIFAQTATAENGMQDTVVDPQALSPGLYFVRVDCGDESYTIKLVKE